MAEQENKPQGNQLVAFDKELASAKSAKEVLYLPGVVNRAISGYQAISGRKDGQAKFDHERSAYLEIVFQKPELREAPSWAHFKVINKVLHNNWSLRDNRVYIQAVKRGDQVVDIKVDPSPALRRAMLEDMPTVKKAPEAQVVLKGDVFLYDKLNQRIIKHETTEKTVPDLKLENILYSYQRIMWSDDTFTDTVVPHDDLVQAKKKSKIKSQDSGLWVEFPAEACKKTATNRAFRLYHKYPDNSVVFDDESDVTDTPHVDVTETFEPQNEPQYTQSQSGETVDTSSGEVIQEAKVETTKEEKKKKQQMNLLDD